MGRGLFIIARKLATDPRVQGLAIAAFNQARPHLVAAGKRAYGIAQEVNPARNPKEFARRVREDLFHRKPRDGSETA
ncbi:MAG TPA: hypothetical protein VNT30_14310 [Stellaceae bacterium]|nr:hypothetical protein [Stellaceae bacterium]